MKTIIKFILFFYFVISTFTVANGSEKFFEKGLKLFNDKKYEGSHKFSELEKEIKKKLKWNLKNWK